MRIKSIGQIIERVEFTRGLVLRENVSMVQVIAHLEAILWELRALDMDMLERPAVQDNVED